MEGESSQKKERKKKTGPQYRLQKETDLFACVHRFCSSTHRVRVEELQHQGLVALLGQIASRFASLCEKERQHGGKKLRD